MVGDLVSKARDAVVAGRDLLDAGDTNGAVNRAYYGVFNVTRAYLLHVGQPIDGKHGAIMQAFGLHLVQGGHVDRKYGRLFNQIQEARSEADYDTASVPLPVAKDFVQGAEEFYDLVVALVPSALLPPDHARGASRAERADATVRRSLASAFCRSAEARGEALPRNLESDLAIYCDAAALTDLIVGLDGMNDLQSYLRGRLPGLTS